eukprot:CAMPEP_0115660292 /NCGR_PEP_ID=MMETSP0272-20121206/46172_1 /TAXON_ID=71861 /ORGANISM="Scrippsiella trochoidea, Strain CCMP3099" /LENGTH=126 /DNA_ID=CAMNT_0003098449 /DNA_START=191 /DNA_END=571 /DNA_ORIENTATION=+
MPRTQRVFDTATAVRNHCSQEKARILNAHPVEGATEHERIHPGGDASALIGQVKGLPEESRRGGQLDIRRATHPLPGRHILFAQAVDKHASQREQLVDLAALHPQSAWHLAGASRPGQTCADVHRG